MAMFEHVGNMLGFSIVLVSESFSAEVQGGVFNLIGCLLARLLAG